MTNLINAKNHSLKRFYLWQVDHYHYRIEDFKGKVWRDLADMTCQQAQDAFRQFSPRKP